MNKQEKVWKTKDGRKLLISEMETSHIKKTIRILHKKGFIGLETYNFYCSCTPPIGEMAQYAFEQEQDAIFERTPCKELDWLEEELEKREGKR